MPIEATGEVLVRNVSVNWAFSNSKYGSVGSLIIAKDIGSVPSYPELPYIS